MALVRVHRAATDHPMIENGADFFVVLQELTVELIRLDGIGGGLVLEFSRVVLEVVELDLARFQSMDQLPAVRRA